MNWLAIDTSMNACGVGIRRADGQFFSRIDAMERGQAEQLMPIILDVLGQAGLSLQDIDKYAITVGPGTFTGLRVGLATIRALAQVSGKPAIGVGTFDVLEDAAGQGPLCVLIETKRSDYYVRAPGIDDGCYSSEQLKTIIKPDWVLAGDATERAVKELALKNKCIPLLFPPLDKLIACAEKTPVKGLPEPVYLRGADVSVSKRKAVQIV